MTVNDGDAEVGPAPRTSPSPRFLRVWSACYELDAERRTDTFRVVSGYSREEIMEKAWRRRPTDGRLTHIFREDDVQPVWTEQGGFTALADELHEFTPPSASAQYFKDLDLGDTWSVGAIGDGPDFVFTKISETHARSEQTGREVERDPWDRVGG